VCTTRPWNTSRRLRNSTLLIRRRLSESRLLHLLPLPSLALDVLSSILVARDRILRREPELTQFETAQIANLCPADAEEAKSIIPRCVIGSSVPRVSCRRLFTNGPSIYPLSLVKIEDDRLQALLDEIQAMRKFQT